MQMSYENTNLLFDAIKNKEADQTLFLLTWKL